ncbi:unnamed protein product [Camellia sinensis]
MFSQGIRSSKFCLNPAGDTPPSCCLFDAIVSHCVPVIVSDKIELPFKDEINYKEFSIFFSVNEALVPGYMVTKLREFPKERWLDMWRRLKNVSHHFEFQYPPKKEDAVNMLWRQVKHKVPAAKLAVHRSQRLKVPDWWHRRRYVHLRLMCTVPRMDKSWMMTTDRLKSKEYVQGVQSFLEFATKNLGPQDEIRCPCVDCLNGTKLPRHVVRLHLLRRGIACSYRTWVHHGERVPLFRGHPTMRNDDTKTDRAGMTTNHENVDELPTMLQEIYMSGLMDDPIDGERTSQTSLRELTTLGIKNAENLAIPSVRNDASFLFTVVETTGFFGVLARQLPRGTMVPGVKTGRRKRATSGNVLSTSEACPQESGTPMMFSDETQPPDDTQTVVEETQPGGVVGQTRSTRVRGPTLGKGVQKKIARKKGKKLHVYVNRVLNAITGGNATPATNELADKFVIGDDFDNNEQAQQILDRKAYFLYKDWRYNLKQEFLELEEKGVDDPYSRPPSGVSLEDWKYLIDVAWKDESHLKRSTAGKANRGMLPYNHTSGSRSFPIAMPLMANEDGDIDFLEFYKKAHKSKKTGDWIDPKCGELHDDMVNLQVTATVAGLPLTHEEISRQVLGEKKNYLRGSGVGPQPSSTASSAARARDKHMELMRAELEVLREQRQSDHEELLKEKEERQRDREELLKEKEERQRDREELLKEKEARERDREEITREREQLIKQVDEEKKAREAQQLQLNHLNDVVSRLTTLLPGSNGHPTIRL